MKAAVRPVRCLAVLFVFLVLSPAAHARAGKSLETQFTTIHYSADSELSDFFWRLSGKRLSAPEIQGTALNHVDGIVERVQAILDMYPVSFHVHIYVYPSIQAGSAAFYSPESKSVTVASSQVTEGVLAHEIAHAVMHVYFDTPLPDKAQEILSQYVDRNLWMEP